MSMIQKVSFFFSAAVIPLPGTNPQDLLNFLEERLLQQILNVALLLQTEPVQTAPLAWNSAAARSTAAPPRFCAYPAGVYDNQQQVP